jgi:hypothetical protein
LEKSAWAKSAQSWDEESERLAREFEKVALELENDMEIDDGSHEDTRAQASPARAPAPKPDYSRFASPAPSSTKYQPRLPKEPRGAAVQAQAPTQPTEKGMADASANVDAQAVDDNDDDYVYDVYIRRPLAETDMLRNPLAELESDQQLKDLEASRAGVGVIVITAEDEEYWENFIEDDEEEWDSEDADSNGKFQVYICLFYPQPPSFYLVKHIADSS